MTHHDSPAGEPRDAEIAAEVMDRAKNGLRRQAQDRWVEVCDRLLLGAMTATRRSLPVLAQGLTGPVHVSEQVLVAHLRRAIEGVVPGTALSHVAVRVQGPDVYAGLIVQLVAQYGVSLLAIADQIREIAVASLDELLGPVTPPPTVRSIWVHFGDVTVGDPRTADPI